MTDSEPRHRTVETNGIRMHIAEQGEGPLVVLLHGFPECWYSWRHQLASLAAAGFHAVAPDQRGYGRTDRPEAIERYTMLHLVGDVIGLLDALGEERAVVVGHDWGAPVAWTTAQFRPDRVRGVVGLSVAPMPRAPSPPIQLLRTYVGEGFYMVHFQRPGVADAELARDVRATLRRLLFSGSADARAAGSVRLAPVVPTGGGFLDVTAEPERLPSWLTEADLDVFTGEFEHSGFTGGLNWYRNVDRNWELTAPWERAPIQPPALYVAGEQDLVLDFPGARAGLDHLTAVAPNLTRTLLLPDCGHWTQQEMPAEVDDALLTFLRGL